MSHILEHKSVRYSWELVRHTYLVDLESEIGIQQVEISPTSENRLLDPPYPLTPFFEIEVDQIQKDGKTVYSFRNICPVQINRKQDWNFLNCRVKIGSSRVTKRFHSQEGEAETRWLYTDDFFLISLSSGDRHDLSMLLSLIISKLNMIALSIQSGRRIRSEFENQQIYRAAMRTMFSEGVDGAFRDVPVYQQHGEITGSGPGESAALMSAASRGPAAEDIPPEGAVAPALPGETVVAASVTEEIVPAEITPTESTMTQSTSPAPAARESDPFANIVLKSAFAEAVFGERAATTDSTATGPAAVAKTAAEGVRTGSITEERAPAKGIPATMTCSGCGAAISGTKKFCGSCGTAVSTVQKERAPALSGIPAGADFEKAPSARPESKLVIDVKAVEELQDLSWLSD